MKKTVIFIGLAILALVLLGSCEKIRQIAGQGSGQAQENFMNSINGKYVFSLWPRYFETRNNLICIAENNIIKLYIFDESENEYVYMGEERNVNVPRGTTQIIGFESNIGFYNGKRIRFINVTDSYVYPQLSNIPDNIKLFNCSNELYAITELNDEVIGLLSATLYMNTIGVPGKWGKFYTMSRDEFKYIPLNKYKDFFGASGLIFMTIDYNNLLELHAISEGIKFNINGYQLPNDNYVNVIKINNDFGERIGIVYENHIEFHEYDYNRQQWVKSNIKDLEY